MEQRGHADEAPGIVRHTRHVCVSSSPGCNETPSGVKGWLPRCVDGQA
jgi:hypothetical protein